MKQQPKRASFPKKPSPFVDARHFKTFCSQSMVDSAQAILCDESLSDSEEAFLGAQAILLMNGLL